MTAGKGLYGGRRVLEGTVVSDMTEKTVVVAVKTSVRHPLYKKIVRRVRKFMAHDDQLDAHVGDVVRIVESRPMSKRKRWRVAEVMFRADLPEVAAASIDLELLGEVKTEEEEEPAEKTAAAAPTEVSALEEPREAPTEEAPGAEAAPEATVEVDEPLAVEEVAEAEPEPEGPAEDLAEEQTVAEADATDEPVADEAVVEADATAESVADASAVEADETAVEETDKE